MQRILTLIATACLLGFAAAQSAAADAATEATATFYANAPAAGAEALAELDLDATADVDLSGARYVVLDTAEGSYTFAVEGAAEAVSAVELAVDHGGDATAATLGDVAARLESAADGTGEVAVFTDGEPGEGTVVALYGNASADTDVEVEGATHVQLIRTGESTRLEVASSGGTLAEVEVASEDGDPQPLVDVDVSAAGGADAAVEAEGDANGDGDAANGSGDADASVDVDVDAEAEGKGKGDAANGSAGGNADAEGGVDLDLD